MNAAISGSRRSRSLIAVLLLLTVIVAAVNDVATLAI